MCDDDVIVRSYIDQDAFQTGFQCSNLWCILRLTPSPGSDVCTQTLIVCAISLDAHDLELHFANNRARSLPGDDEMEY